MVEQQTDDKVQDSGSPDASTMLDWSAAEIAARIQLEPKIPLATYRLMFSPSFTFKEAQGVVPYLRELGISDCYASPYLKARPGSLHGYDVVDHNAFNPDFGSEHDYEGFVAMLQKAGMGQLMDIVPNHMGVDSTSNASWMDVLEHGQGSRYASFFDIDWHPIAADELHNRVLLPILRDPYGKALENQELRLAHEAGRFFVRYGSVVLPLTPRSLIQVLGDPLKHLAQSLSEDDTSLQELQSIVTAIGHLPPTTETSADKIAERQREGEVIRRRIANLYGSCPSFRAALDQTIASYNGVVGDPASFDRLDALLDAQCYRLAYWRVAADEINYRRFFDVNDLAAIRMEHADVFEQTHRLVFQLLANGKVTALRIDHPDGLRDPAGYLAQLQKSYFLRMCRERITANSQKVEATWQLMAASFEDWFDRSSLAGSTKLWAPVYILVEKILSGDERLRTDWPVYGTTGYEFANTVNGIFVARHNQKLFDNIYSSFIGGRSDYRTLVNSAKKMIMLISLASEVNMLGYQLKRISAKNRWYRDFTLNGLTFAIREVIAALPVYRTYVNGTQQVDRQDKAYVEAAIAEAKRRNPRTAPSIFDFIGDILLQRYPQEADEQQQREWADFTMKFQQTSGPVMAKGVEDTVYYIFNRLVSLNEVGGSPANFGVTLGTFHRQNAARQRLWPHSLNCTSTHDTKRSEDVRARVNVLSELPREWKAALARWANLNRDKKSVTDGTIAPDANEEYLFYQTLIGIWPFEALDDAAHQDLVRRLQSYMLKASKEAKVNTSWINANQTYDTAMQEFVAKVLDRRASQQFLEDFASLERPVAHFGAFNSLGQILLKITAPGVPDIYQGNEIWDFSLVDPDNRRPVDFAKRQRMLHALKRRIQADSRLTLARQLLAAKEDGGIKLYVTSAALRFRRSHARLFREGQYVPVSALGAKREHVCAYARQLDKQDAIVAVPRLVATLTGGRLVAPVGDDLWNDSALVSPYLKAPEYRNVFTDEVVRVEQRGGHQALLLADIFQSFPVALLEQVA